MGRTIGVILAAVILTLLPEVLRLVPDLIREFPSFAEFMGNFPLLLDMLKNFNEYRMILYSLLIIILMMARPQGLFTFGRAKGGKA